MIDTFRGYNHNLRIADGEFYEMENITSDYYPVLAPRAKRGVYASKSGLDGITAIIAKDKLCYVDGRDFVVGDERVEDFFTHNLSSPVVRLVSMGAYVIILPEKKYVNTQDLSDRGSLEANYWEDGDMSLRICSVDGEEFKGVGSATTPSNPTDELIWIDISVEPYVAKRYSEATKMWSVISPTYVKISANGIGSQFSRYDCVNIKQAPDIKAQPWAKASLEGNKIIHACGYNYIVVEGSVFGQYNLHPEGVDEYSGCIEIERKIPEMDFVTQSGNRLWGCKYGKAANGEMVNEIYASKLGDFKNWSCYMGLSTDSYAVSVGSDGPFTGAITYLGYPLFFKENCVHKVYGNYPANYQIQTTSCRGVQAGSDKSLAIVNETLFYKSSGAVCAYDGSLPVEVSYALGHEQYSEAVAGSRGNNYYISMMDKDRKSHLFVYDVAKAMWHREDNFRSEGFASWNGELYAIAEGLDKIVTMFGSGTKDTENVKWMVETGPMGTDMPDMKYISRLTVRMMLPFGSRVRIFAQYDSIGGWEHLCTMVGTSLRSFSIPIRPRRCDHMKLRIEGEGDARIYSITKTNEQGSDIS